MLINRIDKTFLVSIDDEYIYIFRVDNLSYSATCGGPLEFRGESLGGYKRFARLNKYMPITEREIAEIFAEGKEITEEVEQKDEQDYYTT